MPAGGSAGTEGAGGAATSTPTNAPSATATTSTAPPATVSPSANPDGNATIYVTGYDAATGRLGFQYATVAPGAGIGGTALYSVAGDALYSAGVSEDVKVISGGVICPPAGSVCTGAELISAAASGFFADAALDSNGVLLSIIERDNASYSEASSPASGPPSPSPSSA